MGWNHEKDLSVITIGLSLRFKNQILMPVLDDGLANYFPTIYYCINLRNLEISKKYYLTRNILCLYF